MPVPDQTPVNSSTANGVTTVFPYTFKILDEDDLVVEVDGEITTDYTVSGVGVEGGGNVTFNTAPADDAIVTRYRDMAIERQDIDYQEGGGFEAETVDEDIDRTVMLDQERALAIKRAPKGPRSVSDDQVVTEEEWAARAGCVWGFDAVGQLVLLPAETSTSLVDLAASVGAQLIGFIQAGTGAVARTVLAKLRDWVHSDDYGTLAQMFADGGGFYQMQGTYNLSGAGITIPDDSIIIADDVVLNVTLAAVADNGEPALDFGSNIRVIGSITVAVTITGGTPANNATGTIRIGNAGTPEHDVHIDNLTYTATSVPSNWNALLIESSSHDVTVEQLTVNGGGKVGRALLVHWGGSGPTQHPYGIEVGTLIALNGDISPLDGAAAFFSGAYDCRVRTLICDSYYSAVMNYAGDNGASDAAAAVADLIGRGIVVDSITGTEMVYGVRVVGLPTITGSRLDMPLVVGSAELTGRGAAAASGQRGSGVALDDCKGVRIGALSATEFYFHGAGIGEQVFDCEIGLRKVHGNGYNGVYCNASSTGGRGVRLRGGQVYNNGSNAAGESFVNGVFIGNYVDVMVQGTELGQSGEANQKYGIQATGNAQRVRVRDTHIAGVKAGGTGYFFGNGSGWRAESGEYMVQGATWDPTQVITPFGGTYTHTIGPAGRRVFYADAAPTTGGTFRDGDQVINTAPAAAGSPGWVCTTEGTFSAATDNTGDTDGSTAVITGMADTSDFFVGEYVTVSAGFASTGPFIIIAKTGSSITVNANSNSSQSNVTVATPDPVFKTMAAVAA